MGDIDPTLKSVFEALEEFGAKLDKMNEVPSTVPTGVGDQSSDPPSRILSAADRFEIREKLKTKSDAELRTMFSVQARQAHTGIPFETWANTGGMAVQTAVQGDPILTKALDTTGATALIRQDLEPVLYELYVREFPAWQRFAKEPANGLTHAYNQITSFGDAQFMTELGTVTDDVSVYTRKTTNVSVIATRRGISLKSQFAVLQGGAGYNPEALELQGGMRAIAHRMQKTIFQGNSTVTGGTASTEDGAYDANAFDGLRSILNQGIAKNVDPTASTPEDMRTALDRAAQEVMDAGGRVNIIYCRPNEKVSFDLQQDKNVRYMNTFVDVVPGVLTNAVNTVFGPLPLAVIPGDSIGIYTASAVSRGDMYLLDEGTVSLPYLGSEGPTVLDIPIGISGQLTHLYIMFGMWGMAVKALPFNNKVRVKQ
jgi:hypothetical protein